MTDENDKTYLNISYKEEDKKKEEESFIREIFFFVN